MQKASSCKLETSIMRIFARGAVLSLHATARADKQPEDPPSLQTSHATTAHHNMDMDMDMDACGHAENHASLLLGAQVPRSRCFPGL